MAFRVDRSPIAGKAIKLDNGWMRAPATLTRVGVFEYVNPDGSPRFEYRPPEEVLKADALASFELVPVTNNHPFRDRGLDANTAGKFSVGAVGGVRADGLKVRADLLVTDGKAVAAIEGGKHELSCGYYSDTIPEAGVWTDPETGKAIPYTHVQRNIRGNHVAIVQKGRAGPEARVHLDSAGDALLVFDPEQGPGIGLDSSGQERSDPMRKITIDGVEYEVSEQVYQAFMKDRKLTADMLDAKTKQIADLTKTSETAQAKLDAAEGQVKTLTAKLADETNPAKFSAKVAARVAFEGKARAVLGKDAKLDGKTEAEISREMLTKLAPGVKLDGKSEDYVSARLDAEIERVEKGNPATREAREMIERGGGVRTDAAEDREAKFNKAVANAWQPPAAK